jgi:hypothetical protein
MASHSVLASIPATAEVNDLYIFYEMLTYLAEAPEERLENRVCARAPGFLHGNATL